jgi:hypothetical protein
MRHITHFTIDDFVSPVESLPGLPRFGFRTIRR